MAKRKLTEPRREWPLADIRRVRHLRDEEGMKFREIGEIMGASAAKCRSIYHTGRFRDVRKIGEACRELGIDRALFSAVRVELRKRGRPHQLADVIAVCRRALEEPQ